jgi:hypothetical protein
MIPREKPRTPEVRERERVARLRKDLVTVWRKSGQKQPFDVFVKQVEPENAKAVLEAQP